MSEETFSRREIRKRARRMFPAVVRSLSARVLLYGLALFGVGLFARPWNWEWLRRDEAVGIVEDFLLKQGANIGTYTTLDVAEYHPGGMWAAWNDERKWALDPAVGYLFHYFREGQFDGWMVSVSPAGQIFRVRRDIPDDEPGLRLSRDDAYNMILQKLATELALPASELVYDSDTLVVQPQRSDWTFRFTWPPEANFHERIDITLSGNAITGVSLHPLKADPVKIGEKFFLPAPGQRAERSRLLGFLLIVLGVFQILMHHRSPLAIHAAGKWSAVLFGLILVEKALTFPQAAILIPFDIPMRGFMARIALGALVEALQAAIIVGLVVATGEAMARDLLPNISTLTRTAPSHRGWTGAWVQAGRYALPLAAVVLVFEAAMARLGQPVGYSADVIPMVAGTLTSPFPPLALPALSSIQVLWDEGLYRLWLVPLLLFWLRGPLTAILVGAGVATYFAGFDPSQFLTPGAGVIFCWAVLSGWLLFRCGILAAILFHLLVLGGYAALALIWTGFGAPAGITVLVLIILMLVIIGLKGERLTKTEA